MEDKFLSSDSILSRTSLCSYFVSWKIYLFTCKKNCLYEQYRNDYSIPHIFAIAAWKKCILWNEFLWCRHLMEKMRNLYLRSQCFNKFLLTNFFQPSLKKEDTIYMRIIYMSFLSRNLLRKNIYTMSSFIWSNELSSILKWWLYFYCIFLFSFFRYEVTYSKNIKIF